MENKLPFDRVKYKIYIYTEGYIGYIGKYPRIIQSRTDVVIYHFQKERQRNK